MNAAAGRRPIAVVQGAPSTSIQAVLAEVFERRSSALRITGVLEVAASLHGERKARELRVLGETRHWRLFQDLGPGSASCSLDPESVANAAERLCEAIAGGCDLVVISKFGKLEAESRSGLLPAFAAAMEADVPILTSVSPLFMERWSQFAAPLYETLPSDAAGVLEWCDSVVPGHAR